MEGAFTITGEAERYATQSRSCARLGSGEFWCWGAGYGLGNGQATASPQPVRVETAPGVALTGVRSFHAGYAMCAVMQSGRLMCWGNNGGATAYRPVFVETAPGVPLEGVANVSMGGDYSCAALSSGQVYCWGGNYAGKLGNGSETDSRYAVRVELATGAPLTGVAEIVVDGSTPCARTTSGQIYCWGDGSFGMLGNGSEARSLRPVRVETAPGASLADVVEIKRGNYFLCARTSNKNLYCWGINQYGQLGQATTGQSSSRPVLVLSGVNAVAPGFVHLCALLTTGNVACWGSNEPGQIGHGMSGGIVRSPYPVW